MVSNPDRGIVYKVDKSKCLEAFVDADFTGNWADTDANNADSALSQTGVVICHANCPIVWSSKLHTEIALSTVEAEYIALSHILREAIPL